MKKNILLDGNAACAEAAYFFTEFAAIYPITPSTNMGTAVDKFASEKRLNVFNDTVNVVEMQSEKGAIGVVHGTLQSGVLASTYTASQGLLLMIPTMYKIAGELLPCTIHVAARSLARHALSIQGDHQDVYEATKTGFAIIASNNPEQANHFAAISHLTSLKSRVPYLHFFDGFRTSNELNNINILEKDEIKDLIDTEALNNFRNNSLNPNKPYTQGLCENDDVYFQRTEVRNTYYDKTVEDAVYYMNKINDIVGTDYKPFNYYGDKEATRVIVAMGSICDTAIETIEHMNRMGEKVGLIEVHLYRPFSVKYLFSVMPNTVTKIAVLDKTKDFGSLGEPLYLDIVTSYKDNKNAPLIVGGRYGLSNKDTNYKHIKAVFDFLNSENVHTNFTVGITDDITNLSIPVDETYTIENNNYEMLIYGYGSDGMISSSKSILDIMSETKYVQGYFQYDSKKSGGITKSHIRVSDNKILSRYYVTEPSVVVCSNESYLHKFNMLENIKENGSFILNTNYTKEEIENILPENYKKIIATKNITVHIINAYKIAKKNGLGNKISTIMTAAIFKITNVEDFNTVLEKLSNLVIKMFTKKGQDVVNANIEALKSVLINIEEVKINLYKDAKTIRPNNIIDSINMLKGNELKTSDFINLADGKFMSGTTRNEKRETSTEVPKWLNENCIQCNKCAFVCPHAVIRPFLLDEEEVNKAPEILKKHLLPALGKGMEDKKFAIGVSYKDCTGCNLCTEVCPGKKNEKALIMNDLLSDSSFNESNDYLFNNVTDKNVDLPLCMKKTQFTSPKFEFSGACAGCGETAYIKTLTQLFNNNLVIANATGCSSIYGASMPSTPYTLPWTNSLFENNAEVSYGILMGYETMKNRLENIIKNNIGNITGTNNELLQNWLDNKNNIDITNNVYKSLDYNTLPTDIVRYKEHLQAKTVWAIGGDGWAYDIDFDGIDHVLSTNDNINILVLDTEGYSNTGGQMSKSTRIGAVMQFAAGGKRTNKKDMASIAMSYKNVYVAAVSLNANHEQVVKAMSEAANHNGPSIIFAYAPCIAHGIKGGLKNTLTRQKLATESGMFPIFRYNPSVGKLVMDAKEPNFELYKDFVETELRFENLKSTSKEMYDELINAGYNDIVYKYNNLLKKKDL